VQLWKQEWPRKELLKRVGLANQLGGIEHVVCCDGKARGVELLTVRTAAGLEFSVVPSRALDIYSARYQGRSLSWNSPVGLVHPAYYDSRGLEWLKTFSAGLVTTCGLTTAGAPSVDADQDLGLHGSISATPAERLHYGERWDEDECTLQVSGVIREVPENGAALVATRRISTLLNGKSLRVLDHVENVGSVKSPHMQLYHINLGFPLLTEYSRIYAPSKDQQARDPYSSQNLASWAVMDQPSANATEHVFYHDMQPDKSGMVAIVVVSDQRQPDFGLELRYPKTQFPCFTQWKMTQSHYFVLGLEPANCHVGGRYAERQNGTLQFLQPLESRTFEFELEVLDGHAEVARAVQNTSVS